MNKARNKIRSKIHVKVEIILISINSNIDNLLIIEEAAINIPRILNQSQKSAKLWHPWDKYQN